MLLLCRISNIRLLNLHTVLNRNALSTYKNDSKGSLSFLKLLQNMSYIKRIPVKTSNVIRLNGAFSLQKNLSGHSRQTEVTDSRLRTTSAIAFGALILCVVPLISYCVLEVAIETIVEEIVEKTKGK